MTTDHKTKKVTATNGDFQKGYDDGPAASLAPSPHQRNRARYPLASAWRAGSSWVVRVCEWAQPPAHHVVGSRAEALALITGGRA